MMKIVKAKSSGFRPNRKRFAGFRPNRKRFAGWVHRERRVGTRFGWQDGYAAFSLSSSQIEAVRRYMRNQKAHHQQQSFMQEFITLLDKHGVEYDERYVFA